MEASQYLMIDYPLPLNILVSYVIFAFSGVEALNRYRVTTPQQLDSAFYQPSSRTPHKSAFIFIEYLFLLTHITAYVLISSSILAQPPYDFFTRSTLPPTVAIWGERVYKLWYREKRRRNARDIYKRVRCLMPYHQPRLQSTRVNSIYIYTILTNPIDQ
jgi:hypothetical protein